MEFQKLKIKFGNQNFGELFKWNFGNWKLSLEIGILRNYLKMEF